MTRLGNIAAHSTENDPRVNTGLMHPDRARTRGLAMEIRDQRQTRRDVARLTDPHERSCPPDLVIRLRMAGQPRHGRPDGEAGDDHPPPAEAVRYIPAEWAAEAVAEEKDGHQLAKPGIRRDIR